MGGKSLERRCEKGKLCSKGKVHSLALKLNSKVHGKSNMQNGVGLIKINEVDHVMS